MNLLSELFAPSTVEAVKTGLLITGTAVSAFTVGRGTERITNYLRERNQVLIEEMPVDERKIILGYRMNDSYRIPIVANMRYNPHMLVTGLSQQGKTSMVEYALRNRKSVLINCFPKDYKSLRPIARSNNYEENIKLLKFMAEEMQGNEEIIYCVIDEVLEMVLGDKDFSKQITRLLATGAHNNIYIIALTQTADKELVKFKNLFNTRVCFAMKEDINYKTALGYAPQEYGELKYREFYYSTNETGKGKTYDL